jgi:hypothetical protein
MDIDVGYIFPASSVQEAITIAKSFANTLKGKLKTIDNIYTGIPSSPRSKIPKR